MEKALCYELETVVTELKGVVYPTNAPESSDKPYLVYMRTGTNIDKTLDGYGDEKELRFMFSIMAESYPAMKSLTDKVEAFLVALPQTSIGKADNVFVDDLVINNISETYEFELGVNRGIIDFTVFY